MSRDFLTKHARKRCTERSIRADDVELCQRFADRAKPSGKDAMYVELSDRGADEARAAGIPADQIRRLRRIRVVVADGAALTVYRIPAVRERRPALPIRFTEGNAR